MKTKKYISIFFLLLIFTVSATAQDTPRDVRDLVGARASSGESALESRGYKFIKTTEGEDRKWSNWWKASTKTCITVATVNGRYDTIVNSTPEDCKTGSTENSGASAGGNDYSDLIGARAAGGESELESRGYKFIKTTEGTDRKWANWWKASTRTCLTVATVNGRFDSIVSGTPADCTGGGSGGNSSGGSSSKVDLSDLVGARAAGAQTDIEGRGFRNTKSSKSGSASFTWWKNDDTNQCVQMTVRNGKVSSIINSPQRNCQ